MSPPASPSSRVVVGPRPPPEGSRTARGLSSRSARHGLRTISPIATPTTRAQKARGTRAEIAGAALELFVAQGFADTTIDQIAGAAGVSRRTVFHHFATKDAILFDHLVVRREVMLERLRERPPAEPILASLHGVLRDLCAEGYDRRLLAQVRAVLTSDPRFAGTHLWAGVRQFQEAVVAALEGRAGMHASALDVRALTLMALDWVVTTVNVFLVEDRRSLVECFDAVVAVCVESSARDLAAVVRTVDLEL